MRRCFVSSYGTTPGTGHGQTGYAEADEMEVANTPLIAMQDSTVDASYVPCKFSRVG